MCPVIMWAHDDTPLAVAHGALYGIEQGLSRMTFYRAGNDLVDAGLIAIHSGRWHATINGRRVAGGEDA